MATSTTVAAQKTRQFCIKEPKSEAEEGEVEAEEEEIIDDGVVPCATTTNSKTKYSTVQSTIFVGRKRPKEQEKRNTPKKIKLIEYPTANIIDLNRLPDLSKKWLGDEIGQFITLRGGDPEAALRWFVDVASKMSFTDNVSGVEKSDQRLLKEETLSCSSIPKKHRCFPRECFALKGVVESFSLFPYQAFVLRFALFREEITYKAIRGGILNLFPGLGKTFCLLSMIWSTWTSERVSRRPTLVVVPTSVVYEWRANVIKFFDNRMPFFIMDKNWNSPTTVRNVTMAELMTYPLIITTYPVLRSVYRRCGAERECVLLSDDGKVMGLRRSTSLPVQDARYSLQTGPSCLYKLPFARVAFDESQAACNPKTITFQSCYSVPGDARWCLTGMPLRNKSLDLFGQLLIVGLETPKRVSMLNAQDFFAVHKSLWKKEFFREQKLSHAMLTVTYKDTHLKMPEMHTVLHPVLMNPAERSLYELFAQTARSEYQRFEQGVAPIVNVLTCVTRMRQACDCPYLLHLSDVKKRETRRKISRKEKRNKSTTQDNTRRQEDVTIDITADVILNENGDEQADLAAATAAEKSTKVFENVLDPVIASLGPAAAQWCRTWNGTGGRMSSKITAIVELVRRIVAGEEERSSPSASLSSATSSSAPIKVIVYSAFAQMLYSLSRALKEDSKHSNTHQRSEPLKHCIMTGETLPEDRTRLLDLFRLSTTHNIIFMTYKVGSLGLTLTEASHVIFTEPWFCYEVHLQALYRAYRIGQPRPVTVHWMISHAPNEESAEAKTQSLTMIEWRVLQIASRKIQMTNELIAADLVSDVPKHILEFMGSTNDDSSEKRPNTKGTTINRTLDTTTTTTSSSSSYLSSSCSTTTETGTHIDNASVSVANANMNVSNTADTLRSVLFPERYAAKQTTGDQSQRTKQRAAGTTNQKDTGQESFLVSTR